MPFTNEYKVPVKNLFELKGYNARHLVREFLRRKLKYQFGLQIVAIATAYWLVNRRPCSGR